MGAKQSIDDFILDVSLKAYSIATTEVKEAVKESAIFALKGFFGGYPAGAHKSINETIENARKNAEFSKHPIKSSIELYKFIKENYKVIDNYHLLPKDDTNLELTKKSIGLGIIFGTIGVIGSYYFGDDTALDKTSKIIASWEYTQVIGRTIHMSYFQTPIGSFKLEGLTEVVKPFIPFFDPVFNLVDKSISEIAKASGPFVDGIQKSIYSLGPPNLKYLANNPLVNYIKGFIK